MKYMEAVKQAELGQYETAIEGFKQLGDFKAVSYTHLDVYKRQAYAHAIITDDQRAVSFFADKEKG